MATAKVLHLREDFDHGGQAQDGGLFGVKVYETITEARAVGQIVVGGFEIFVIAGCAVLGWVW